MWDWITQNSSLIQAAMAGVTALVWLVYLHILVSGLRRQRRTAILIHLGGSRDLDARFLVSNLGFEPIYVLEIMLAVRTRDGEKMSSVVDRTHIAQGTVSNPRQVTLQGPLKSGDLVDIGSVDDLLDRARGHSLEVLDASQISEVEITVAAVSAADSRIAAATRRFSMRQTEGQSWLCPQTLTAEQIRSSRRRRRIEARLSDML